MLPEKGETRGRKKLVVHVASVMGIIKDIHNEAIEVIKLRGEENISASIVLDMMKRLRKGLENEIKELEYEKD